MKHFFAAGIAPLGNLSHRLRNELKRYLALLLAVLLLMTLLYVSVERVIRKQTQEHAELVAEHFSTQAQAMLRELEMVSSAILRDSAVTQLRTGNALTPNEQMDICSEIADYLEDNPYAEHAYLIPHDGGVIFTEKGVFENGSLPTLLQQIGATETDLIPKSDETAYHLLNENRLAPFCVVTVRNLDREITHSLIVTLRMSAFIRLFQQMDAELCTVFNDDVYISSYIKNISDPDFNWRDTNAVQSLIGKPVACYYLEANGYTYMVAISRNRFNQPLRLILGGFCLFALALVLLAAYHVVRANRRRRDHMAALLGEVPESYQGDQSLDAIYDNIRSSLEAYRTQQESYSQEQRERRLHRLLTQENAQEVTDEELRSIGLQPDAGCYYVATFFVTNLHNAAPEKEHKHDLDLLIHMLFRSTMREVADQYELPCAICCGYKIGTAVFWGEDAKTLKKTILELSEDVIELMTNTYTMHMQVTISAPVLSAASLREGYAQTHSLRSFAKSINSTTTIISQEALEQGSGILLNGDFIRQEQILINTILVKKYDAVPSMVEAILTGHVSPLRKNYTLAQSRLTAISNILVEGLHAASSADTSAAEAELKQADSVEALMDAATRIYGQQAINEAGGNEPPDFVRIACKYIEQNLFDQNLNVTAICEAAGISVQRLTRLFQSSFGMAIAEYVNACRISKAKVLLNNPDLTAASIAQQIGYSNADTFTRNFKKLEGITPTEYRRLN